VGLVAVVIVLLTLFAVTLLRPSEFHLGREGAVSLLRAPELFMPLLIAGVSAWALWRVAQQRRGATVILFAVLAVDLFMWGQSSGWYTGSPRSTDEYWGTPEVVTALHRSMPANSSAARILTAPHTFDPTVPPVGPSVSRSTDWILWTQPDVYMLHQIPNAAGYDGFGLARYSAMAGQMKVWGELTDPDAALRGPSREIDLTNARFLVSMRKQSIHDAAGFSAGVFLTATQQIGGFKFASNDLGLPVLSSDKRLVFFVPSTEIDHLAFVTSLAWSENVPDNTVIGHLRLKTTDGQALEFPLRAGVDTAEWSHDRPDIQKRIRHRRAEVAGSYEVNDANGNYQAHSYLASVTLPQKSRITGGEIVLQSDPRWPDLNLTLFRLSLVNSGTDPTFAVRKNSIVIESSKGSPSAPAQPAANARWKLLERIQYVDIYENLQAMPRVWLASGARVLDDPAMLETIRAGKFPDGTIWDPAQTALIESPLSETPQPGKSGHAEIKRYEPNRIDVATQSDANSILVLSENHYPGWRTYIDGRAVETLRVDYNLRGVPLTAGAHKVEFVYQPKSVLIGLALSILALIGLVLLSVLGRRYFPAAVLK
jgi:hypothetical protein